MDPSTLRLFSPLCSEEDSSIEQGASSIGGGKDGGGNAAVPDDGGGKDGGGNAAVPDDGGGKDGGVNAAVPDDLEKKQGVDSGIACKEKATLESSSCRLVLIVEMKLANSLVRAAPKTLEDRAHFISRT